MVFGPFGGAVTSGHVLVRAELSPSLSCKDTVRGGHMRKSSFPGTKSVSSMLLYFLAFRTVRDEFLLVESLVFHYRILH